MRRVRAELDNKRDNGHLLALQKSNEADVILDALPPEFFFAANDIANECLEANIQLSARNYPVAKGGLWRG